MWINGGKIINGCSECKNIGCGCGSCKLNSVTNVPKSFFITDEIIMCPKCGTKHQFEDFAEENNEYSYKSHMYFEDLKKNG